MITAPTNRLLDALSPASQELILRSSKHMPLPVRMVLMEAEQRPQFAYFPTEGIASVVVELEEGGVAEVALIGREGVVGGLQMLGPALASTRCFMQVEGSGYRIPFATLKQLFLESEEIRTRVLEMVQQQSLTVSQLAACNKLHEAEPRLARWLLMVRDRVQQDTLHITQEFLAQMLGTQRTTVVMAAGALQRSGLVAYSRGRITILSVEHLEDAACDCYQQAKKLYNKLYQPLTSG
ncbi:MAG: Crp/Fnr family transcriptional regulator [Janthinobacterium lividum]